MRKVVNSPTQHPEVLAIWHPGGVRVQAVLAPGKIAHVVTEQHTNTSPCRVLATCRPTMPASGSEMMASAAPLQKRECVYDMIAGAPDSASAPHAADAAGSRQSENRPDNREPEGA